MLAESESGRRGIVAPLGQALWGDVTCLLVLAQRHPSTAKNTPRRVDSDSDSNSEHWRRHSNLRKTNPCSTPLSAYRHATDIVTLAHGVSLWGAKMCSRRQPSGWSVTQFDIDLCPPLVHLLRRLTCLWLMCPLRVHLTLLLRLCVRVVITSALVTLSAIGPTPTTATTTTTTTHWRCTLHAPQTGAHMGISTILEFNLCHIGRFGGMFLRAHYCPRAACDQFTS